MKLFDILDAEAATHFVIDDYEIIGAAQPTADGNQRLFVGSHAFNYEFNNQDVEFVNGKVKAKDLIGFERTIEYYKLTPLTQEDLPN